MSGLEQLQREVADLRTLAVGLQRANRRDEGAPLGDQFIALAASALMNGLGRPERAAEWAKRAVTNPAMTTVTGWAAELISGPTTAFLLSMESGIRAVPGIMRRARGFPISVNTRAISLSAAASAKFTEEGAPISVVKATLAANGLLPYSVKCIATFSEELGDHSKPVIDEVLRQILGDAVAEAVETVFFSDDAQLSWSPAGALQGATVVPPGASFAEDVRGLVSAISPAVDPVFIMSPARLASLSAAGGLIGFGAYGVFGSSAIPDDTMAALDAAALVFGAGTPSFKLGREATLHEDTDPAPISTPGTPPTIAAPTRSLWQTNTVSLKCTLPISWTSPKPAAIVSGISW